jgi:hypothetical protein
VQTITLQREDNPQNDLGVVAVVQDPSERQREAFALHGGAFVHTAEWNGSEPAWDWAAEVNPTLASDPELCRRVERLLRAYVA